MRFAGIPWLLQERAIRDQLTSPSSSTCSTLLLFWTTALAVIIALIYWEYVPHRMHQANIISPHLSPWSLITQFVRYLSPLPAPPTFKWGKKKLSNLTKITQPGLLDTKTYILNHYSAKSVGWVLLTEYQTTTQFICFNWTNKNWKLYYAFQMYLEIILIFNYLLIICYKCSLVP